MKRRIEMKVMMVAAACGVLAVTAMAGPEAKKADTVRGIESKYMKQAARLHTLMVEKLKLTDDQKGIFEDMFAEQDEALREHARSTRDVEQKNREARNELTEELRAAHQAGDKERVKEIQEELSGLQSNSRAELDKMTSEFYDQIRQELEESQIAEFDKLVKEVGKREDKASARLRFDSTQRMINLITQKCNPTKDQSKAIQQHQMRLMTASMDRVESGDDDMTELQAEIREDILGELTDQQKQILAEAEAEAEKKAQEEKEQGKEDKPTPTAPTREKR